MATGHIANIKVEVFRLTCITWRKRWRGKACAGYQFGQFRRALVTFQPQLFAFKVDFYLKLISQRPAKLLSQWPQFISAT